MPVLEHTLRDLHAILQPLSVLRELSPRLQVTMLGGFACAGRDYVIPRVVYRHEPDAADAIRLAIFGGLHGDEPAGVLGAVAFLERLAAEPARGTGYEVSVYPLCNPVGYERDQRENAAGLDLNRLFWRQSDQPEIRLLERELSTRCFDGIIALHSDDTAEGIYGYTQGRVLNESLLEPALRSASYILPRDRRPRIDGWAARDGKIDYGFDGVLSAAPGQRPRPFDLIFETPALAPIDRQVEATVTALDTILDEYRVFLAYAQNL